MSTATIESDDDHYFIDPNNPHHPHENEETLDFATMDTTVYNKVNPKELPQEDSTGTDHQGITAYLEKLLKTIKG